MRFQKKVREDKVFMSDITMVLAFLSAGAVLLLAGAYWDIKMLDLAGLALAGAAAVFVLVSFLYWLWTVIIRSITKDK